MASNAPPPPPIVWIGLRAAFKGNIRLCFILCNFSSYAKNLERKSSEEIVSKSCWACAISRPLGVLTRHTGQTGCVTGAWTMCLSAGQSVPTLSKWPEKRLGSSLVLKFYCVILNRIFTRYLQSFFFSLHFSSAKKNLCYQSIFYATATGVQRQAPHNVKGSMLIIVINNCSINNNEFYNAIPCVQSICINTWWEG